MPTETPSLFEIGRNCWRIERTNRMALIVDAADYFVALRGALKEARSQVLLIGWDFDLEIEMLPGESDAEGLAPDGLPNALGPFVRAMATREDAPDIYLLKWNGAVLMAPGRLVPGVAMQMFSDDNIHFALDGHHPFGACHHQKIVVVDDALAFCGGIDATEDRWDTSDHAPGDPRRVRKDGSPSPPWHDATTAMTGPVAGALGEFVRTRWHRATGEELLDPEVPEDACWPDGLPVAMRDVDVAIARTDPPYDGAPLINEIEELYLAGIRAASEVLYIESQYFAGETICAALEDRLREEGGPEIVIVNPQSAFSALEDASMHTLRGRMMKRLAAADREGRHRVLYPANAAGEPIYVHAKILIADERHLHIGSSNIDDRSMGFDTECDVAVEACRPEIGEAIAAFRLRLLAEHLGASTEAVERAWDEAGSLIGAIEALSDPKGRGLRAIRRKPEGMVGRLLADTRLLDTRFYPGQATGTGQGLRPRHLALGAALAGLGAVAWFLWGRNGGGRA